MANQDFKTTRTYYWTWQGCSLCAALAGTGVFYLFLHYLIGLPDLTTGALCGVAYNQIWSETKYDVSGRPDKWYPDRRET